MRRRVFDEHVKELSVRMSQEKDKDEEDDKLFVRMTNQIK